MLKDAEAIATIAVRKIDVARRFYEETLGLEPAGGEGDMRAYRSGSSTLMVYESQFAGTNRATAATWLVGSELESLIGSLKAKGVKFEHYDLPDTRREGDIHVSGKVRVAWFKDPDGNILSIANG
ncbi:MAG TPA: VOC family protein [Gemmatimonadales bacterium]|nr:VOC family protein [Gemmatimonadales bacterium]